MKPTVLKTYKIHTMHGGLVYTKSNAISNIKESKEKS